MADLKIIIYATETLDLTFREAIVMSQYRYVIEVLLLNHFYEHNMCGD